MKPTISQLLLLFFLSVSLIANAQKEIVSKKSTTASSEDGVNEENKSQNDTLLNIGNSKNVKVYSFYSKYINSPNKIIIDTSLHSIELYNPNKQTNVFYQDLGNIGSAGTPLIFNNKPKTSFSIGITAFDLYLRDLSNIEIIETPSPFTQLSYFMGSKKENVLRVQHSQSFMEERITAGIDFKLINSIGYYARQKTDVKNFNAQIGYKTKDNRYSILGIYFHNKLVIQENGGIIYDSLFELNIQPNRQIISINLPNAENYIKYSGIGFQQNFYLAKAEPDFSAIPDTNIINLEAYRVYHFKKPYFDPILPLGRLTHTFQYTQELYYYNDKAGASDFYTHFPSFPSGVTTTSDSISLQKIENVITYSNSDYKDNLEKLKFLTYSLGIGLISNRYRQDTIVNTLTEIAPQARLQLVLSKLIFLSAKGLFSYRSDNSSSYNINGILNLALKKNELQISLLSSSTQAGLIYQHFYSNYFHWENEFVNQKHQELQFQFSRALSSINAKSGIIHDFLYFNETLSPQQYKSALSYFNITFAQGFRFGNFGMDINVTYQNVSDNSIVRIPKIYSNSKLFYTNTLFKGALDLELGLNLRYYSKYFANAYMPALRSFYIQNEKEFGNYPFVDLYVNAKIKRARLFFKYEQLNSGFMPQNYFISPHYPNSDASFKFGVTWQLFN